LIVKATLSQATSNTKPTVLNMSCTDCRKTCFFLSLPWPPCPNLKYSARVGLRGCAQAPHMPQQWTGAWVLATIPPPGAWPSTAGVAGTTKLDLSFLPTSVAFNNLGNIVQHPAPNMPSYFQRHCTPLPLYLALSKGEGVLLNTSTSSHMHWLFPESLGECIE